MSSENYIVINGKKRQLSEAQLKLLGVKQNPYERVDRNALYYYIDYNCDTYCAMREAFDCWDTQRYDYANYFNDESFAEQVALHQLLYRKLLKFAWDNEAEDVEWDGKNEHYSICYDYYMHYFLVTMTYNIKSTDVFFSKKDVAQRVIKEVIEPFMEVNSDFVW